MHCARTGAATSVEALLGKGADPNAAEGRKAQTALMWAAAFGHGGAVRALLEAGADVSARSVGGFTPLLFAARSGNVATALALLEGGADPDESTPEHGNALVVAAAGGHEDLGLFLLGRGASPAAANENGITALHHAVAAGMAALNGVRYDPAYRVIPDNLHALADALLAAGADPDRPISSGLRLGPDGSPFEMEGMTPFLLAAVSADVELLRLFRVHEADPNVVAAGGTTALIAAARAACTGACAFAGGNRANEADVMRAYAAVEAVLAMGADIDARNEDGQTAMHMAAFTGSDPIVRLLAEHGAGVNVVDNYGQTPWSMASGISPVLRYRGLYGNHTTTVALLEGLGATKTTREARDPNAPPPPGQ
jgi:ankyrin repeat protein